MTPADADGGSDRFAADLRALTDQQRADQAAGARRRAQSLRTQSAEAGSFAGVLVDLGEREQSLAISTLSGRTLRGVIRTIGADFVGLRGPSGEGCLVALAAIAVARAEPGAAPSLGDRVVEVDTGLAGVLAGLAPERPWLSVHTASGEALTGSLLRVGLDVLAVRSDAGATAYVPLRNLSDVVLP